jgi:hypothetical protein
MSKLTLQQKNKWQEATRNAQKVVVTEVDVREDVLVEVRKVADHLATEMAAIVVTETEVLHAAEAVAKVATAKEVAVMAATVVTVPVVTVTVQIIAPVVAPHMAESPDPQVANKVKKAVLNVKGVKIIDESTWY